MSLFDFRIFVFERFYMSKTFTVNGVTVDYETYNSAINSDPNDFGNLNNIDAPDIPQIYKDYYANDRRNERAGRGHPWWTPRQRMLDNIEYNEKKLAEKKAKRLAQRQRKMDAWAEQCKSDDGWQEYLDLMRMSENDRVSKQQEENRKSTIIMTLVIGGGFLLMCLLFVASVYIKHGAG